MVTQEVKHVCKIKQHSSEIRANIKRESLVNQKLYIEISNSFKLMWDINNQFLISMNNSHKFMIDVSEYKTETEFHKPLKENSQILENAILSWYEEEKDMALHLSRQLGVNVKSKNRTKDSTLKTRNMS